MRPRAFSFAFVSAAIFGLIVACGGGAVEGSSSTTPTTPTTPATPATPATPGSVSTADASADATLADASSATTVGSALGGKVCGCSLCAPVVSDDTCNADADCLPEVPCHATRCVGKAHATPRQAGLMCTEIMRCDSTDANACGCVKGKCTLSPRAAH